MRVNIYSEEMTDRIEIVSKEIDGHVYTGIRFYLELPVTLDPTVGTHTRGPFIHRPGDDDSSAVTFWGKRDLRKILSKAQDLLDTHYSAEEFSKRVLKQMNEAMNRPIEELELSVRSYNCLKNANIQTIGDLTQKSEAEMLKINNFGRRSLRELKEILSALNLTFGMKFYTQDRLVSTGRNI